MNKKPLIVIGIILFIGIAVFAALNFLPGSSVTPPTTNPGAQRSGIYSVPNPPVSGTHGGTTTVPKISIATAGGGLLQTKDFKTDPETVKDAINPGYYYLGYHFTDDPTKKVPYVIEYIDRTQYFNIGLFQEPIAQFRKEAEQYLMMHLGISENQMCALRYAVSVPYSVNKLYTSMNLGFSFCPGSVVIPE